jgi:hypothetical protein
MSVQSFDHLLHAGGVLCKNALWVDTISSSSDTDIRIHVKECNADNCEYLEDCGNRYLHVSHHLWKCVVAKQFDNNGEPVRGLKVREGYFIPARVVIGEYTGTVVNRGGKNMHSRYIVEIDETTFIDAEKEGNCTTYINHRFQDFNAVLIPVKTSSTDTLFICSIKEIQENEFVSFHYGSNFHKFFDRCLCESCCPKESVE